MIEPIVKSVGGIEVHKGVVVVTGDLSRFLCLKSEEYELVQCEICNAPGERSMEIL
jgi:formylmethanofuran dehydrogenase subunit C